MEKSFSPLEAGEESLSVMLMHDKTSKTISDIQERREKVSPSLYIGYLSMVVLSEC